MVYTLERKRFTIHVLCVGQKEALRKDICIGASHLAQAAHTDGA